MWVHLWLPCEPGMDPAWPVPVDAGEDGDDVALGDADDDVVDALDVPAVVAAPPVDASATPVKPAPSPAATTPVMISRRARPPVLETIGSSFSRRPAARCGRLASEVSLRPGSGKHPKPGSQRTMSISSRSSGSGWLVKRWPAAVVLCNVTACRQRKSGC